MTTNFIFCRNHTHQLIKSLYASKLCICICLPSVIKREEQEKYPFCSKAACNCVHQFIHLPNFKASRWEKKNACSIQHWQLACAVWCWCSIGAKDVLSLCRWWLIWVALYLNQFCALLPKLSHYHLQIIDLCVCQSPCCSLVTACAPAPRIDWSQRKNKRVNTFNFQSCLRLWRTF